MALCGTIAPALCTPPRARFNLYPLVRWGARGWVARCRDIGRCDAGRGHRPLARAHHSSSLKPSPHWGRTPCGRATRVGRRVKARSECVGRNAPAGTTTVLIQRRSWTFQSGHALHDAGAVDARTRPGGGRGAVGSPRARHRGPPHTRRAALGTPPDRISRAGCRVKPAGCEQHTRMRAMWWFNPPRACGQCCTVERDIAGGVDG
jgi:hypothetical protein